MLLAMLIPLILVNKPLVAFKIEISKFILSYSINLVLVTIVEVIPSTMWIEAI